MNSIYIERRNKLLSMLPDNSIVVIASAEPKLRTACAEYYYRQDSNFWYFTGINEAQCKLVLYKDKSGQSTSWFFSRTPNDFITTWSGDLIGPHKAALSLECDAGLDIEDFSKKIKKLANKSSHIYCLKEELEVLVTLGFDKINDLSPFIAKLRIVKDKDEISLMRIANEISVDAHLEAMQLCRPGMYEYQIEAEMLRVCYSKGCRGMAYNSIVASGDNACTLHYDNNSSMLKENDLLLIDAGGEYQNYASDISRTFPVNGKFSSFQKDIYQLVLESQVAAINMVKPGIAWGKIQEKILSVMIPGLLDLKLLAGSYEVILAKETYKKFYMHSSGHWLGLDVHDVGGYSLEGQEMILQPGMIFTIEPGIYIKSKEYRSFAGIGVRIEDNILVTESGFDNLTDNLPKSVEAIETVVGSK